MKVKIAWIGIDCHARKCAIYVIDQDGNFVFYKEVPTEEKALIECINSIEAEKKQIALEECGISRWIYWILKPHATEILVSNPAENRLISKNAKKRDKEDAHRLARLYRLGELKPVWQPPTRDLAILRDLSQGYIKAVSYQVAIKLSIKSEFRHWGVLCFGSNVFHSKGREAWLDKLSEPLIKARLLSFYNLLDRALIEEKTSRNLMILAGKAVSEIKLLQTFPGVGKIGAHVFAGKILVPERFDSASKLSRYSQLGIRDRSSDGKPLGYQKLDSAGNSSLKEVAYRAWLYAMKKCEGPVYRFYQSSLKRTGHKDHARLNTQRKILVCLWQMWLRKEPFNEEKFFSERPNCPEASCSSRLGSVKV